MVYKHLQLNTSKLANPEKVFEFITTNKIDIACLQEVVYPTGEISPLKKLADSTGLHYLEGVSFQSAVDNLTVSEAIISRYPFDYHYVLYYNAPNNEPKVITREDILGALIHDSAALSFPGSRSVKHVVKSRCIIIGLIKTPDGVLRVITTHFPLSDFCIEISQMLDMAKLIIAHLKYAQQVPTLLSGDLNVRSGSYSVELLSSIMECHTKELTDTLASGHEAKKHDFPEGLAIDHVFSSGLLHNTTSTVEVDFSNHKAIISDFSVGV